jgi:hypothetical protein
MRSSLRAASVSSSGGQPLLRMARCGVDSDRFALVTMDKGDDGGPFSPRYLIVSALRITGHVDLAVLQGASAARTSG